MHECKWSRSICGQGNEKDAGGEEPPGVFIEPRANALSNHVLSGVFSVMMSS
jgi:hypothetical protein